MLVLCSLVCSKQIKRLLYIDKMNEFQLSSIVFFFMWILLNCKLQHITFKRDFMLIFVNDSQEFISIKKIHDRKFHSCNKYLRYMYILIMKLILL